MTQGLAAQFEAQLNTDIDSYYTTTMALIYDEPVCSNSTPSPPPMYFNGCSAYTIPRLQLISTEVSMSLIRIISIASWTLPTSVGTPSQMSKKLKHVIRSFRSAPMY